MLSPGQTSVEHSLRELLGRCWKAGLRWAAPKAAGMKVAALKAAVSWAAVLKFVAPGERFEMASFAS